MLGESEKLSMPSITERIEGVGSDAAVMSYSSSVPTLRSQIAVDDDAIALGDVAEIPKAHHPSPLASIVWHVTANVVFPPADVHARLMAPSGESNVFVSTGVVGDAEGTVPGAIVGALVGAVGAFVGALVGATARLIAAELRPS